jgi:hypothetical protein
VDAEGRARVRFALGGTMKVKTNIKAAAGGGTCSVGGTCLRGQ